MTETNGHLDASRSGTFAIGGDLEVNRLGFGAMRLTGDGIWGEPEAPEEAEAVLRRVVEIGMTLIDTADSYGPDVSERLIGETLSPYPEGVTIATKGGLVRPGPGNWQTNGRPEHLREACEGSLRRLKLERIDLYQLHRIDPDVPAEESLGMLSELRDEGKIRHVGLSEVGVEEIQQAQEIVPIATVQNRYNLTDRGSEDVLDYCETRRHRLYPVVPAGYRRPREGRRPARRDLRGARRPPLADSPRLAPPSLPSHAPHPWHFLRRAPGRERRRSQHRALGRRVRRVGRLKVNIGIVGSGNIGANAARLFAEAGHDVAISNSRGPEISTGIW